MSAYENNKKYLQSLVDQLKPIPKALATRVAVNVFMEMLAISTEDDQGFDSGQAAANWRIQSYIGSPVYDQQSMLWGYGDINPIAPVGYKSWYTGMTKGAKRGETGNPERVYAYMFEYATLQAAQIPDGITGISVYNPIVEGFGGFAPGNDQYYEQNALGRNEDRLSESISRAVIKSVEEVKLEFSTVFR